MKKDITRLTFDFFFFRYSNPIVYRMHSTKKHMHKRVRLALIDSQMSQRYTIKKNCTHKTKSDKSVSIFK